MSQPPSPAAQLLLDNQNKFYVHAEDFVDVLIGPFDGPELALSHFMHNKTVRGDGAGLLGIYSANSEAYARCRPALRLTPEKDRQ